MDYVSLRLHADPLLLSALREDMNGEDVSTLSVVREPAQGTVDLLAKEDGVLCGLSVFSRVFELLDPTFHMEVEDAQAGAMEGTAGSTGAVEGPAGAAHSTGAESTSNLKVKESKVAKRARRFLQDGDEVHAGQKIAVLFGDLRALLSGERTALNILQRLSGIATYARKTAKLLEGTNVRLVDTRKTTPGFRFFEKYAVRIGGASNHRFNLTDGVMLKDNHVDAAGGITQAIQMARDYAPFVHKIEVEVETPEGAEEAANAGADVIMLDNMSHDEMKRAIELIGDRAEIEISGNVTPERIAALRDLKVDYISSGALTYAAPILDLSMKHLKRLS